MTYRPLLPRLTHALWRCLTQPDHPEPPPAQLPETFPQHVDYIVHNENGHRTEQLRIHIDIDSDHRLCGTWPIDELRLEDSGDDCA